MDSIQAKQLRESVAGKSVGGWQVVGDCGTGKSAVVLRAKKDGVEGALKIFHPELVERYGKAVQLERINRERSLVGESHPHLIRILDGGECPATGHLYVVMEYLPFKNLQEVLQNLPVNAHQKIIMQVASAAEYLETKGLAHRDIKPENIAISDDFQRAVLLDLGVLRPIGLSDLTDVNQRSFIGTLRYSSPEFLLRKEEDTVEGWRALTFYQLGAVLHDMLMKRPLFHTHTEPFSELVLAITGDELPEITSQDTYCTLLAQKALIKTPETRLKLVQWGSFAKADAPPENSSHATMQRLRERQQVARAQNSLTGTSAIEAERTRRIQLMNFSNQLDAKIGNILNELGVFPLRVIKPTIGVAHRSMSALISFEKDKYLDLQLHLHVKFDIKLLDENNGTPIYQVFVGRALAAIEIDGATLDCIRPVFSGSVAEFLSGSVIMDEFVEALDAAYVWQAANSVEDVNSLISLV